jgi:hypothetical protein
MTFGILAEEPAIVQPLRGGMRAARAAEGVAD